MCLLNMNLSLKIVESTTQPQMKSPCPLCWVHQLARCNRLACHLTQHNGQGLTIPQSMMPRLPIDVEMSHHLSSQPMLITSARSVIRAQPQLSTNDNYICEKCNQSSASTHNLMQIEHKCNIHSLINFRQYCFRHRNSEEVLHSDDDGNDMKFEWSICRGPGEHIP